jgi:outer membrane lipoprotein-sorting protein
MLLAGCPAFALDSDKEVQKLLASMRTAYSTVESASLLVKTEFDNLGKRESQSISMSFQKPNLLHLDFSYKGQTATRICDGKKVYTMGSGGGRQVMTYSLDALGGDLPINLESMSFFDWKRQLSTSSGANMEKSRFKVIPSEQWNDRDWIVLEETAHGQNVFVRYFIDPRTYYIWRCEVKSIDSKKFMMETEVQKLMVNVKLDPKLFAAPKGN